MSKFYNGAFCRVTCIWCKERGFTRSFTIFFLDAFIVNMASVDLLDARGFCNSAAGLGREGGSMTGSAARPDAGRSSLSHDD